MVTSRKATVEVTFPRSEGSVLCQNVGRAYQEMDRREVYKSPEGGGGATGVGVLLVLCAVLL